MNPTVRLWLGTAALSAISVLAAFFVVFNVVFSDVFGLRERLWTFLFVAVNYLVFGLFAGLASPGRIKRWVWILSAPAALILVLYTVSERSGFLFHLAFAVLVPLASMAGVRLGAMARNRKKPTVMMET